MQTGMYTDTERCVRAVQSKDARFDGWFVTAVTYDVVPMGPVR